MFRLIIVTVSNSIYKYLLSRVNNRRGKCLTAVKKVNPQALLESTGGVLWLPYTNFQGAT